MNAQTVNDTKYGLGRLIACAEPPADSKLSLPVVVVMMGREVERLNVLDMPASGPKRTTKLKG